MTTQDKRTPALQDLDPMPYGKWKGTPMQDLEARYLAWLWRDGGCRKVSGTEINTHTKEHQRNMILVANYIFNSKEALEEELGEIL